jgi:Acetyltransferase (GNAT) domain
LYREHGFGLWLLTLKEAGEYVGDCGLTPQAVDGVTEIEVGYHVRAALQGRGLATEAAAACRDYARDVLKVDRLIAIIGPRNGHPSGSPRSSAWWSSETATTTAAGTVRSASTPRRCTLGRDPPSGLFSSRGLASALDVAQRRPSRTTERRGGNAIAH